MKLSSASAAKLLLSLSLVIATVSAWQGVKLRRETRSLQSELATARQSEERARNEARDLATALRGNESPLPLDRAVTALILALHRTQVEHRVLIGAIAPAVNSGRVATQDLEALSTPVGRTVLRALTVEVKGTYREYAGLVAYMQHLRAQSVAITRVRISGNAFDLQIKIFGTLS